MYVYIYICIHICIYTHICTYTNIHLYHPCFSRSLRLGVEFQGMKIAFIIARERENVVVLFGTLKVQSFMLTEVRDCYLLIVVTSSTFLQRKDVLKEKGQLAQIIKARSPAYI